MAPLVKTLQRSVPCFFTAIVGPTSQALQGSVNECLAAFIFCVGRAVSTGQWPLLWLLLTLLGLRQQGAWGRTHDVRKWGAPLPGHLLRARARADASRLTDEVKDKGNANSADDKDGSDGAHSDFADDRCSLEGAWRGRGPESFPISWVPPPREAGEAAPGEECGTLGRELSISMLCNFSRKLLSCPLGIMPITPAPALSGCAK